MADRFSISANGNGRGIWSLSLNPIAHNLRPSYKQNSIQLIDGSVFIIEPSKDSTVLTLSWQNLPEDTYGSFVFGQAEGMAYDKVYLYYTSALSNPLITDMTYEAETHDTVNMPFIDVGAGLSEVSITDADRILVGHSNKFNGVLFDFEEYLSNLENDDGEFVDQVRLRFSPTSGNLASGDSITFDGTTFVNDDDTELLQHYGQIRWSLAQVANWGQCSMNDIISGTSEYSTPSGFSDTTNYYWCEIQITPDMSVISYTNPKLQAIKVALDSLDALAARKSNGILPIWYLNIPDSLQYHRPRGYRGDDWIGVKVTNFAADLVEPRSLRWNVTVSMIPILRAEQREYFILDYSRLDGESYLQ